jgi:hypothetical protein
MVTDSLNADFYVMAATVIPDVERESLASHLGSPPILQEPGSNDPSPRFSSLDSSLGRPLMVADSTVTRRQLPLVAAPQPSQVQF